MTGPIIFQRHLPMQVSLRGRTPLSDDTVRTPPINSACLIEIGDTWRKA